MDSHADIGMQGTVGNREPARGVGPEGLVPSDGGIHCGCVAVERLARRECTGLRQRGGESEQRRRDCEESDEERHGVRLR